MSDTIFALASANGTGGVAIIRTSGGGALKGALSLTGAKSLIPRKAYLKNIRKNVTVSRETVQILDKAVVIFFESPASYTGEDVVEYHVHGGRAVIDGVIDALSALPDHRPAQAGEFTRRAFQNDKMDLTAAEGLADLINAQTQVQAQQALAQMDGSLARLYNSWRDDAIKALAHAEANLEFPDEDLPDDVPDIAVSTAQSLCSSILEHLQNEQGQRLREGLHVAILGAPNAGKSSLINALSRRDVAITSDIAGTTRDVISVQMNLGGYPITLYDTAGLRRSSDVIELEGIRRALQAGRDADIKILLFDGTQSVDEELLKQHNDAIVVCNKSDSNGFSADSDALSISAKNGDGVGELLSILAEKAKDLAGIRAAPALTRARHKLALEEAAQYLKSAQTATQTELLAEDLRMCARCLGRITGRVDVEDVLDSIFRDFCIGK